MHFADPAFHPNGKMFHLEQRPFARVYQAAEMQSSAFMDDHF
ncbi:hypothetical protein vBSsoS008_042 [Shigella phage vB_SsoS_008]|nr:hypothetical protein vBSsoS008_042 [Shigella phage vB_SsoS_008]